MTQNLLIDGKHIINCPRCFEDHKNIIVRDIANPIIDPTPIDKNHPCVFISFSICPTTQEPILFKMKDAKALTVCIKPPHSYIEKLAYAIWEAEGRPENQQEKHWHMAEYTLTQYWIVPSAIHNIRYKRNNLTGLWEKTSIQNGNTQLAHDGNENTNTEERDTEYYSEPD